LIEYAYDPIGRRIAKKINGTIVEKYLWKGRSTLLAVYDGNDNLLMRFMYADARVPLAMTKAGLNYYLCYDQVGSLRFVTDTFGDVVKELDYDSFGNILSDSDPTFRVPFAFAGGLYDPDTGLVHFGYRDYDPDTGRWISEDPLGFGGGDVNLFAYVDTVGKPLTLTSLSGYTDLVRIPTLESNLYTYSGNNPVMFIDPDGQIIMAIAPYAVYVMAAGFFAWAAWWFWDATHPPSQPPYIDKPPDPAAPGSPGMPRNFPPYEYVPSPPPCR
jgi:RHS repeat-associated protein